MVGHEHSINKKVISPTKRVVVEEQATTYTSGLGNFLTPQDTIKKSGRENISSKTVLQLQRTIGNRAVIQLLGRSLSRKESDTIDSVVAIGRFIVDDSQEPNPSQLRKSEFLATLKANITEVAAETLAEIGQSPKNCPYIPYWFNLYNDKDVTYIERAIEKYAPQTKDATDWQTYIKLVTTQISMGFQRFVTNGSLDDVPEDVPKDLEPGLNKLAESDADISDSIQRCWPSNNYERLNDVGNLPDWGSAEFIGYHFTNNWPAIKESGEFRAGGGKLGNGIYVTDTTTNPYASLGRGKQGTAMLEVGYIGDRSNFREVEIAKVSDYDNLRQDVDVWIIPGMMGQTCYVISDYSNVQLNQFRVRETNDF